MNIAEEQKKLEEEFGAYTDWMDKYTYLVELGKALPPLDEAHRKQENLISGCQSQVWLHAEYREGRVYFFADSDAIITKGIVSLLIRVLSGKTASDILQADMGFIDTIGLKDQLTPTRANGLMSMIKQMKLFALVFKTKYEKAE